MDALREQQRFLVEIRTELGRLTGAETPNTRGLLVRLCRTIDEFQSRQRSGVN